MWLDHAVDLWCGCPGGFICPALWVWAAARAGCFELPQVHLGGRRGPLLSHGKHNTPFPPSLAPGNQTPSGNSNMIDTQVPPMPRKTGSRSICHGGRKQQPIFWACVAWEGSVGQWLEHISRTWVQVLDLLQLPGWTGIRRSPTPMGPQGTWAPQSFCIWPLICLCLHSPQLYDKALLPGAARRRERPGGVRLR